MKTKGAFWYWSCSCGNKLKLFARAGLTEEYCAPQMKGYCREIWRCACEPQCNRTRPGEIEEGKPNE